MKHNFPWNVSGIPPEAREIARSAAQREGTSVGDWLTRRILAESAHMPLAPEIAEDPAPVFRHPREEEVRRGSEQLARLLPRNETESEDAFRRIDETLRNLARRLENNERANSEAQRAMSAAASEINTATRDQAQAFQHLTARIDRVERQSDTGALRDAVRALHQGLSRLAEQIAKTTTESGCQIAALSSQVEMLAGGVASARDESNQLGQALEEKLASLDERVKENEDHLKLTTEGIQSVSRLDETVAELEKRTDAADERMQDELGRHLVGIERSLEQIGERLERAEKRVQPDAGIPEALRNLTARIAAAEKNNSEALGALESSLCETAKRIETVESVLAAPVPDRADPAFELPPFADPPPLASDSIAPPGPDDAVQTPPVMGPDERFIPSTDPSNSVENYLAQARRAARAAAEPDGERGGRVRYKTRIPGGGERKTRNRLARMLGAAAVVLLILSAGILLTPNVEGRLKKATLESPSIIALNAPNSVDAPSAGTEIDALGSPIPAGVAFAVSNPPASSGSPAAPARGPAVQQPVGATLSSPPADSGSPAAPVHAPAAQQPVGTTPTGGSPLAQLVAQANGGNAKAALSLGLKYADGDGIVANDTEAARWLQKAAEAGEALAQYRLGTLYERGRGVAADARQAMHWYGEAAKHGNRRAMHNLAVGYADGAGTDKDFTGAARWFKAAAELGLTDSQFNLAVLYERGLGVKAALPEAYKWYSIAAAAGDSESKARIGALAGQLSPADRDSAEKAAKAYHPQPIDIAANGG